MNDVFRGLIDTQAEKLLVGYRGSDPFFFATPAHTLLTQGHYAGIPAAKSLAGLSKVVEVELKKARFKGHPHPIVVGAIPFDPGQPASLCIPHQVMHAGPLSRQLQHVPIRGRSCKVTPQPQPQVYAEGVAQAVAQIKAQRLSKVVLARTLALEVDEPVDVQQVLARLARRNTHGYTFAVKLDGPQAATLVGASPELLLSRRGLEVRSNPLAGSAARVSDPLEDAQRSRELLYSSKDLHEHRVVTDAVAQGLRPYCRSMEVPQGPSLITTATMWHLSSDIRGELADPGVTALELAAALHPTPAVCGYPTQAAFDLIREIESFERGYYTGMVGWCDEEGNGEWVVTLRCAQVQGRQVRLFAGAGVVAESDPASELAETEAKFRTMLQALGLTREGAL